MDDMAASAVDEAFEVDAQRYKADLEYRRRVHADMDFAEGEDRLGWNSLFATDEELAAAGESPIFSSGDYPTEEAAMAALEKLLDDILEGTLREVAAKNRLAAARPQGR